MVRMTLSGFCLNSFGACGMAPVVMVNDDVHQRVKPARVGDLVAKLAAEAAAAAETERA